MDKIKRWKEKLSKAKSSERPHHNHVHTDSHAITSSSNVDHVDHKDTESRAEEIRIRQNIAAKAHNNHLLLVPELQVAGSGVLSAPNIPLETVTVDGSTIVDSKEALQVKVMFNTIDGVDRDPHRQLELHGRDLWSLAFRDALEALRGVDDKGREVVVRGEKLAVLFDQLNETYSDVAEKSLIIKGSKYLDGPLKGLKMFLDFTSPFTNANPIVSTAFSAVQCVTTVAVGFCGAEQALRDQITTMIENVGIIEECDQIGQSAERPNVHKALVLVYKDVLRFYLAALEIVDGKKVILSIISSHLTQRIAPIVNDFNCHAQQLRQLVQLATTQITCRIRDLLLEEKIEKILGIRPQTVFHNENHLTRADDACSWIVQDANFLAWYNAPTSGQVVLFGEMGSGKTILTNYVIDRLIQLRNDILPSALLCYHYCRKGETAKLESIYCTLIGHLLEQQMHLKVEFDEWHTRTTRSKLSYGVLSAELLGEFLSNATKKLDRLLFVVVDGLDECDSKTQTGLSKLLDDLNKTCKIKVFFSSRPYEDIKTRLSSTPSIRLLPDPERDRKIVQCLVGNSLDNVKDQSVKKMVVDEIAGRASGSAIWARMTVELIRSRAITTPAKMHKFLKNLPPPESLSQVYADLLDRVVDGDKTNLELASRALEILAVARRPLSIREIAWAMALAESPNSTSLDEVHEDVDASQVLYHLQPFIADIDFEDQDKRQLRLVHVSIKQEVLQLSPRNWSEARIGEKGAPEQNRCAQLEGYLLGLCVRYLLLSEIGKEELFTDEEHLVCAMDTMAGDGLFDDSLPADNGPEEQDKPLHFAPWDRGFGGLFVYASCYWLEHLQSACVDALPPMSQVAELCKSGTRRLDNWVQQYCRPDCTVTPKFAWDPNTLDPLAIVAAHGCPGALQVLLESYDISDKALEHAIANASRYPADPSTLCNLFDDESIGPRIGNFRLLKSALALWVDVNRYADGDTDQKSREIELLFDRVTAMREAMVTEQWGNWLLCKAAEGGCLPMIERLFSAAADDDNLRRELLRDEQYPGSKSYMQSVGEAVWENRVQVVRYLLNQDGITPHLHHVDNKGQNVLHLASRYCNPDLVQLLTSAFPHAVHQTDKSGDQPLVKFVFATSRNHERYLCTEILLESGADVKGGHTRMEDRFYEPLSTAVRNLDLEMCRILVKAGADPLGPLARGVKDGRPYLVDVCDENTDAEQKERVLALLLSDASQEELDQLPTAAEKRAIERASQVYRRL